MSRDKQNIKTTDWLTRGMTEAEIAKVKEEAIDEADAELRDKQIEEMAKICHFYDDGICHLCEELLVSCDRKCDLAILVENLYTAGYRKASEVAREIFEEIAKIIQHHDELAERDKSEYGELIVMDIGCAIAELKKKYTESEDTE